MIFGTKKGVKIQREKSLPNYNYTVYLNIMVKTNLDFRSVLVDGGMVRFRQTDRRGSAAGV